MPLKPGTTQTIDGYTNSMAQAMESAFKQEWPNVMQDAELREPNEEMKLMFVAIARGVVKHLQDNHDAFKVTITTGTTGSGTVSGVDVV